MNRDKLVTTQLDLCEIRRRLEEEGQQQPPAMVDGLGYGPCLLVSRECGSLGGRVARLAAERLGWQMFDREIVEEMARRIHVGRSLVATVDERVPSTWDELRATLTHEGVSGGVYLHCLEEVIQNIGHKGKAVILGRGAQYVLPVTCGLRVRIVAPLHLRVHRVAERERLTWNDARYRVGTLDEDRAAFVRKVFQRDVSSSCEYDLVVNTGELDAPAAANIVLAALAARLSARPAG